MSLDIHISPKSNKYKTRKKNSKKLHIRKENTTNSEFLIVGY
jgi:hypothetical protein